VEGTPQALLAPEIQATLMAEAMATATVGFLIWDDDRHYIAANRAACRLLGGSLEEIVGSVVGSRTLGGDEVVATVIAGGGGRGRVTVERFDGSGPVTLDYVTFSTRTAGLPYMASVIWPAVDDLSRSEGRA
jgi:PAS domain-containing protein